MIEAVLGHGDVGQPKKLDADLARRRECLRRVAFAQLQDGHVMPAEARFRIDLQAATQCLVCAGAVFIERQVLTKIRPSDSGQWIDLGRPSPCGQTINLRPVFARSTL